MIFAILVDFCHLKYLLNTALTFILLGSDLFAPL